MRCFLLLFLLFPAFLYAQVDSLERVLRSAEGTQRITVLNELTIQDTQNFLLWHNQAVALADQVKDVEGKADAFRALGKYWLKRQNYNEAIAAFGKAIDLLRVNKKYEKLADFLDQYAGIYESVPDHDKAITAYSEALSIYRKLGIKQEAAGVAERLAIAHFSKQDFNNALKVFQECLLLDEQLKDSVGMAATMNNIAMMHYNIGQYDEGLQYLFKALGIYKSVNDQLNTAHTLQNIAINYRDKAYYDLALQKSIEAAKHYEKLGTEKELSSCYNTIANIQLELGATEKALSYHFLSLKIREKIGYKRGIAISLTNIGNVYKEQEKYDKALDYLSKSLKLKDELGDRKSTSVTLDLLGEVYHLQNMPAIAENHYLRALELAEEVGDQKGIAGISVKLGQLYAQQGWYSKAAPRLETARNIAISTGARDVLVKSYEALAQFYRMQGNAQQAFAFYDKYTALKDSLLDDRRNKALAEMQVKYETEHKEQEILLLGEKQKAQLASMEKKNTIISALGMGAGLLIVLTLVSFAAYRSKQRANRQSQVIIRQKQELIEQEKIMMKELHHRVKNNLQLLSGLLLLQKEQLHEPNAQHAIDAVEHRVNAMLLVHQELYMDKARSQVSMSDYIHRMISNLLYAYGHTEQSVKLDIDVDDISMEADTALNLGLIINEVVSNSFKHAFNNVKEPRLDISLKRKDKQVILQLGDNGPGISDETLENKGASFGLRLVEMLGKEELKGKLDIHSQKGAKFRLIIE